MDRKIENQVNNLSSELGRIKAKAERLNQKILAVKKELVRKQDIIIRTKELVKPLLDDKNSEDVRKTAENILKVLNGSV